LDLDPAIAGEGDIVYFHEVYFKCDVLCNKKVYSRRDVKNKTAPISLSTNLYRVQFWR
jgi:hypothetical protein